MRRAECKALALAGLLSGIAVHALAQEVGATIIEHGIYTAETIRTEHMSNGFDTNVVRNICHVATTTSVPARLGVQFGFRFRVDGAPLGSVVELRRVTRFPTPTKPPGAAAPVSNSQDMFTVKIGTTSYVGFGFDHSWEVASGLWSLELWPGNRLLVQEKFDIGNAAPTEVPRSNDNCFQVSSL